MRDLDIKHIPIIFSEKKEVELSLNDWLDGIQKTVRNSMQEAKDKESEGTRLRHG